MFAREIASPGDHMKNRKAIASALALGLWIAFAGSTATTAQGAAPKYAVPSPPDYANATDWLCRPGHMAACTTDLTATIVKADGSLKTERWHAKRRPKIDCFYVYPTASFDAQPNSDLIPGTKPGEEISFAREQFARFASVCRLFAPMYRSTTIAQMLGQVPPGDRALAYGDVLAALRYYLAHDNGGRGVVLIGHSQGTYMLRRLIAEEIDGKPVQKQIVSALLIGGDVVVPAGKDVGGDFKTMPLCRSKSQIGCVVAYSTFRASSPPPPNSELGLSPGPGLAVACNNPAALGSGKAVLKPYFATQFDVRPGEAAQLPWTTPEKPISTDFVTTPGLVSAECVSDAHGSYLAITLNVAPEDARVHEIKGDVQPGGNVMAEYGLHLIDVHLVMGDLIDLVKRQAKAYARQH
jgi:Protein of unknown function (DUF3089)